MKTLIQTLSCKLSSTLTKFLFLFAKTEKFRKLSYELLLVNFHLLLNEDLTASVLNFQEFLV